MRGLFGKQLPFIALVAVVLTALGVAGCGSSGGGTDTSSSTQEGSSGSGSSGSSSKVVQEASKVVDVATQPTTKWPGPTEPAAASSGKKIGILSCTQAGSGCSTMSGAAKEAAEYLGWETVLVDGKGEPSTISNGFEQLLQDGVDGIVMAAIDYPLVKGGLAKAKAAGIPVACITCGNPQGVGTIEVGDAEVKAGETIGDYMIQQSEGEAQVGILEDKNFGVVRKRLEGVRNALGECSECAEVETRGISTADIDNEAYEGVMSLLTKFPAGELDYIVMSYDASAVGAARAIKDMGRTDVKLVGFDATPEGLALVHEGLEAADYATPLDWNGWEAVDQLVRSFDSQPLYEGSGNMPGKLIVESNAPPEGQPFTADLDFQKKFEELWTGK